MQVEYRCKPISIVNRNLERVRRMMQDETPREIKTDIKSSRICDPPREIVPIRSYNSIPRKIFISILTYLRELELEKDIIVHYAIENGTRSHNVYNELSSYDVKFVFSYRDRIDSHKMQQCFNQAESINKNFIKNGIHINFQGWQFSEFTSLLKKHNISVIEALDSSIIYLDRSNFRSWFLNILDQS